MELAQNTRPSTDKQTSVASRDSYYTNKWDPVHADVGKPSQENLEQSAQEDAAQEQATEERIILLLNDKSTVTDELSSLSLETPEFICVAAEICCTTQLYSALQNTWTTVHGNATANGTTANNLCARLTKAL